MENVFGLDNVFYDEKSDFDFDSLNEAEYIRNVLLCLKVEMGPSFSRYDFFVYANHKKRFAAASVNVESSKPKILLYLSDELARSPAGFVKNYFAVFKAYHGYEAGFDNVFPFGLGYVKGVPSFPIKAINERKFDVFFSGNLNKNRIDFYRSLSFLGLLLPPQKVLNGPVYRDLLLRLGSNFNSKFEKSIIRFTDDFKNGFALDEYGRILADTKIVLCPKGFSSPECFRHYEAMRAGCVVISERLPDNEFYSNSPIIQVDSWKRGIQIANELRKDPLRLEALQKEVVDWWENKLSEKAMATFINRKISKMCN